MDFEVEILGFVVIFIVITGAFYFFVINDRGGDSQEVNQPQDEVPSQDDQQQDADNPTEPPPVEETNLTNMTEEEIHNDSFYSIEELHWNHMPVTYRVNNLTRCQGLPLNKMFEAFAVFEEASEGGIYFVRADENETADVNLSCVDRAVLLEELEDDEVCKDVYLDYRTIQFSGYEVLEDKHFLTSLSLVEKNDTINHYEVCYVDKTSASVSFDWALLEEAKPIVEDGKIIGGSKTIFTADSEFPYCVNFPAKEVHDTMHLFGFAHTETPVFDDYYGWFFKDIRFFKDMMFPYTYCAYKTELSDNYVQCLKYIYSNGEKGGGCAAVSFIEG